MPTCTLLLARTSFLLLFSTAPPSTCCSSLLQPAITHTTAPCRPGPWRYAGWTRSRSSCAPGREPRYRASISIDWCAGCATCTAPRCNHRTLDHIMQGASGKARSDCRGKEKGIELQAECIDGNSEGMGSTRPDALPHGLFADEPGGIEQPHTKCFVGDARDGHIPKHTPSTPQCCIGCVRAKERDQVGKQKCGCCRLQRGKSRREEAHPSQGRHARESPER